MSLGKASIKRASAASKKKAAVEKTLEVSVENVNEEIKNVEEQSLEVKPVQDENVKIRPVRLTEEMPTFLL